MESMFPAFAGFPGFDPFMMVNTSETCATTRLRQCRDMGVYTNDVSRKFNAPWSHERVPDLRKEDFEARKKIIRQVADWAKKMQEKTGDENSYDYVPILYRYEIVKTAGKKLLDWGDLIFIDTTTTRALLVMLMPDACNCGNYSHHDYDALTKYQADRFISLMKYVYHDEGSPNWVRATYLTPRDNWTLPTDFFDINGPVPTMADIKARMSGGKPPIFVVTPENFVPSLLESEVEKIDNLFARASYGNELPPRSVRDQVIGSKETKPEVATYMKEKFTRTCAHCGEVKETNLKLCSRCKLAYYCGTECQRFAWPTHKLLCKQSKPEKS